MTNKETAMVLNKFFCNIISNLNIPQYNQLNGTSRKINDPVVKSIIKYSIHPSVTATKENYTSMSNLNFLFVDVKKLF